MSNEEMVLQYQQGKVSFEDVYNQCRAMIHKEAGRWMIKGMDYEDKVSILMEAFWQACQRYDGRESVKFSSFCITHLRYVIRDHWRRASTLSSSKYQVLSADGTLSFSDQRIFEEGLIQVAVQPDQAIINKELMEVVQEQLTHIQEPARSFAQHFLFEDMTKSEIAKTYQRNSQNIQYHMNRALQPIRKALCEKELA